MKLQILHKGLLLIFVPLLLQMFFFIQLFKLENESEALQREEARHSRLVAAMDATMMEYGTTLTTIFSRLFGNTWAEMDPEGYKARMDALFADIRSLPEKPDTMALFAQAQQTTQEQYLFYKELKKVYETSNGNKQLELMQLYKMRPRLVEITNRCLSFKQVLLRQLAIQEEIRKKNENRSAVVKQQILVGAAVDFTATVILLIAFLVNITKRLKLLVSNAQMIPTGTVLQERVSGSDELALLDTVLHDASEQLQSAKEYRKSLMEMVAHDLRTPLSTAKSIVEILLTPEMHEFGEQPLRQLNMLKRSTIQLMNFVEDLLTIDRLESGKLELELSLLKIHSVIDQCFEVLSVKAQERGIKLVKEGEDLEVVADQSRIMQVLMNLLSNAIKHSPDGDAVIVRATRGTRKVIISVIDEGKGIEKAEQNRIFQKFVQSKDAKQKEGFGLGLAICKLIVDAHQGKIGLISEVGKGSEFWFELPDDEDV